MNPLSGNEPIPNKNVILINDELQMNLIYKKLQQRGYGVKKGK